LDEKTEAIIGSSRRQSTSRATRAGEKGKAGRVDAADMLSMAKSLEEAKLIATTQKPSK
jgi:hypothetical protein